MFYASLLDINGKEKVVDGDIMAEWGSCWKEMIDKFEESLSKTPKTVRFKGKISLSGTVILNFWHGWVTYPGCTLTRRSDTIV